MSHVHPTQDDPVVRSLSEVLGGPVGEHAGPPAGRSWWITPLAVLLGLTGLVLALGMTSKAACAADHWAPGTVQFSHLCYSDIPHAYVDNGLDQLAWPWSGDPQERQRFTTSSQPALVGLWAYAAARVTHVVTGSPDLQHRYEQPSADLAADPAVQHEQVVFTAVNAVGLALVALAATAALSRCRRRRPWDAAAFGVAPVLALSGFVSWDLLAAACVAGALFTWSRGRPVATGILVGLGAAAGVWPALLLVALALTSWRRGRLPALLDQVLPASVVALGVWAVVNAPAFLSGRTQWNVFWHESTHRGPQAGSVWAIVDQSVGIDHGTATTWSWALVAVWWVGVALLALRAPMAPRVSQVALLLVAGLLVVGVDYRPQQVLWLLPLAALARPRWRDQLLWQGGEVFYFAMVWWWLGGILSPGGGGQAGFYWIAIGVHLVATGWLVAVVVRDVLRPGHDPLRDERERAEAALGADQDTTTRSNVVVV